jgi:hypothetical protein
MSTLSQIKSLGFDCSPTEEGEWSVTRFGLTAIGIVPEEAVHNWGIYYASVVEMLEEIQMRGLRAHRIDPSGIFAGQWMVQGSKGSSYGETLQEAWANYL